MTIYSCEHELEAMLTCIYVAWSSGKGFRNIKLMLEPIEQYTLFDEYIHVDADTDKSNSVADAICNKISPYVYRQLAYYSMAYEEDVLDNMYRVLLLGFNYGSNVLSMVQYKEVMRYAQIRKRLSTEACKFKEVVRFHALGNNTSYDIDDSTDIGDMYDIYIGTLEIIGAGEMAFENSIIMSRLVFVADSKPNEAFFISSAVIPALDLKSPSAFLQMTLKMSDQRTIFLVLIRQNLEHTQFLSAAITEDMYLV